MIRNLLYLLAGVIFLLLLYIGYGFTRFIQERNQLVEDKGIATTRDLRDQVDGILSKISDEGERLAKLLGARDFSSVEVEQIIKESALSISEIQGVTACFEPYGFSADQRLYCPYYNKGTQDYLRVGEKYDYTVIGKGTAWYTSVRDEGAKWVEPYFAKAAQDWYVDYGIPFYYSNGPNKGKIRGTITMSFVCGGFNNLVHSISLGKTGYGMITTQEGNFLAHPMNEYIGTTKLQELETESLNPALVEAFVGMQAGEAGKVGYFDEQQQEEAFFYYDKIPSSGWSIGLLFYKNDLLNDAYELNRRYIQIAIVLSLLFICLLAIHYNKDYLDEGEIWRLSIVASLLLIANTFLIGYLQHNTKKGNTQFQSPPITDLSALNSFIHDQHIRSEELKTPKAIPVPTGLYLQRMEFEDSYNLNVGGKIWQKYPLDLVDSITIGFDLPQMSPFSEAAYVEESYRQLIESKEDEAGYLLVGWDFRVTLRLNFVYGNYPLDKRHINIEIVPLNNNDHLVFTPDLSSYNFTNPSRKSGLHPSINISGSDVLESYFNYSLESYDTDFGYGEKGLFEEVPVLHYNIYLRRKLLNSFVTYLIPIFVTMIMSFILIYACGKTQERQGIIESMAAFLFVLIFSHIDLRKEIVTADLIYMEYFYFATYLMIVLSTFNLITYTKDKSAMFDFNDNQLFKAAYFPAFFLMILIVTLIKFY